MGKLGITVVRFQGVSNYLNDVVQKVSLFLDDSRANFVFGLVDLYGIPPSRIDLSKCATIRDKVETARAHMRNLVDPVYRDRFRQHFAVHEVEAWLLACPEVWPRAVRDEIQRRPPEEVNFNEPPARFLKRILRGRYQKKRTAMNLFPRIDPQAASEKCPYLNALMQDLLRVAKILQ